MQNKLILQIEHSNGIKPGFKIKTTYELNRYTSIISISIRMQ